MSPIVIYIHMEEVDRILMNIFETDYCRWFCKDSLGILIFSYDTQWFVSNNEAYDIHSGKNDW
jgi:hypothetical protein